MQDSSYYLCSGELYEQADKYRQAYIARMRELREVAEKYGGVEFRHCRGLMKLHSIKVEGDPPERWTKKTRDGHTRPKKLKANKEVLEHFAPHSYMIPKWPPFEEFCRWLGCPTSYEHASDEEDAWAGFRNIGNIWEPIAILWYSKDGPMVLVTPDVRAERESAIKDGRKVKDDVLDWEPPAGAELILREKWDLMVAEHKAGKRG